MIYPNKYVFTSSMGGGLNISEMKSEDGIRINKGKMGRYGLRLGYYLNGRNVFGNR